MFKAIEETMRVNFTKEEQVIWIGPCITQNFVLQFKSGTIMYSMSPDKEITERCMIPSPIDKMISNMKIG